jgi:hypothetical protein
VFSSQCDSGLSYWVYIGVYVHWNLVGLSHPKTSICVRTTQTYEKCRHWYVCTPSGLRIDYFIVQGAEDALGLLCWQVLLLLLSPPPQVWEIAIRYSRHVSFVGWGGGGAVQITGVRRSGRRTGFPVFCQCFFCLSLWYQTFLGSDWSCWRHLRPAAILCSTISELFPYFPVAGTSLMEDQKKFLFIGCPTCWAYAVEVLLGIYFLNHKL